MTQLPDSAAAPAKTAALINKKDTKLQKRINKALAVLKKNGTTKKISEKYFGTDITK
jgi:cystine transport system substrate-binding protein